MSPAKPSSASDHLISGGASGLASSVALQPLDLLKTRIQQDGGTSKSVPS
jgi:solute carrier family 25 protein 38